MAARGGTAWKLLVALLYLAGALLLLPGFLWVVPECVQRIPQGPATVVIPIFGPKYASGIHTLIVGMALVQVAALMDCCFVCRLPMPASALRGGAGAEAPCRGAAGAAGAAGAGGRGAARCVRMVGPAFQVLGSLAILAGCVALLPRFALAVPPKELAGLQAPDLGARLFQLGSAAYFLGALVALRGLAVELRPSRFGAARGAGLQQWLPLPAFTLFLVASSLLFVNGLLPKAQAVQAGQLRVDGACCLLLAVLLLFLVTCCEAFGRAAASGGCGGARGLAALEEASSPGATGSGPQALLAV